VEQHDFIMEIIDADGAGGAVHRYSTVHGVRGAKVRVRHRVRRLVEPELPDDDPDSGSAVVEDWIDLDLGEWPES